MVELGIVAIIYDVSTKARQQSAAIMRCSSYLEKKQQKEQGAAQLGNERTNFPSTSRQGLDPGNHSFPRYTVYD